LGGLRVKIIVISGTPGVGKSYLASKLSLLLDYEHIDGLSVVKSAGKYEFDEKSQSFLINSEDFVLEIMKVRNLYMKKNEDEMPTGLIIDSHMSHFLPCDLVYKCIILTCELKALKERLEERGYSDQKIRENLDSEIFKVCETEALEKGHDVLVLESEKLDDLAVKSLVESLS